MRKIVKLIYRSISDLTKTSAISTTFQKLMDEAGSPYLNKNKEMMHLVQDDTNSSISWIK